LLEGGSLSGAEIRSQGKRSSTQLEMTRDAVSGKVTVSWTGSGVLKQASALDGKFKPLRTRGRVHTTVPEGEQMVYRLEAASGSVYSVNAVGYVNLQLPPDCLLSPIRFSAMRIP
jgi:hypothetical protein